MKRTIIAMLVIIRVTILFSQELPEDEFLKLPSGFREIVFGVNIEDAKLLIQQDGYFDFMGDPDVSMLLTENRMLIESDGRFYIKKGYFQFYNEILYSITLILDTEKIDFHSIYTSLKEKYGQHTTLSPNIITWEDEKVRLQLEKPLTLKYIDLNVFNSFIEDDRTKEAIEETLRRDFINEL